jgi:type I restriction enzyme S subunit
MSGNIKEDRHEVQFGPKTRIIPDDWEVGRLGDNTYLKGRIGWHGLTEDDHLEAGEYFLVTGTDFEKGRVQWNRCKYVNKEWYEKDPNIQLEEKDILVTKDGSIGKTAFVESLPGPATLNNGIFVIRPTDGEYHPKFFYYILNSFYFDDFIETITAGSTISHLYQKDFVNFRFPLPPLREQRRIVDILSTVDEQIQQTDEIIEARQELTQELINKLVKTGLQSSSETHEVQIGPKQVDIRTEWDLLRVDELVPDNEDDAIRTGPFGSKLKKEYLVSEGIKVYEQSNVYDNDFTQGNRYVTQDRYNSELTSYDATSGDVLITLQGTIGDAAVIPENAEPGVINQKLMRVRVDPDICLPEYFALFFDESHLADFQIEAVSHGAVVSGLNISTISGIRMPVPSLREQQQIVDIIETSNTLLVQEQKHKRHLKEVKRGLMQDLLTGKVRVDPE